MTMAMKRLVILLAVLIASRALVDAESGPQVDHHQHLFSPAIARLLSETALSSVTVPAELEPLLTARARANRDTATLAELYTPDAVMLRSSGPSWVRGNQEVVGWWKANQNNAVLRLTPISVAIAGSRGHVAAYVSTGPNDSPRHVAQVLLSVAKAANDSWRIAAESLTTSGPSLVPAIPATALISLLDGAGIHSAAVLSVAYIFGSPVFSFVDEYERVRAENDWTSQQVAAYPQRLRGFCSVNPLKDYALSELSRCGRDPHLRTGLKLHFGSSAIDLHNPEHVARVREMFHAANGLHMALVVHLRTTPPRTYGAEEARIFLREVVPAAPDVPIQIAHMAGAGPGWNDPRANDALSVFAAAVAAREAGTARLLFDVATRVDLNISPDDAARAAAQMRRIGLARILFGSDAAAGGNLPPRQAWTAFRQLPLSEEEFRLIGSNVAPYMR